MYHFCTYFDRHYLVQGLALYRSLTRNAEPFVFYVLCQDSFTYDALSRLNLPDLFPIPLEEFERDDADLLRAKQNRSRIEYYFTCTPSLLLYILNHFPKVDVVTYLDADLFFYSSPAPIYDELGEQSILIVGHRFPEQLRHLEKLGIYNVGLLAFRNDGYARECLHWWRQRCLEWCYQRAEDGRFADQKYLDDWPTRFRKIVVLQHKGANVAPWNIAGLDIREFNGSVLVDSYPLIFFHFTCLRIISSIVFDPGLDTYGAQLSDTLKRQIYGPYLRELRASMRQVSSQFGGARKGGRTYVWRDLVYLVLRGRKLLLIIGAVTAELNLGLITHPVAYVRQSTRRRFRDTRT